MIILGASAGHHDAALAVLEFSTGKPGRVLFAAHAERHSRRKNDPDLHPDLVTEALSYGRPDRLAWYERPWRSRLRMALSGERGWTRPPLPLYLARHGLGGLPVATVGHHVSHAAAGFWTSGFDRAAVLVLDAVGEFDTETLWVGDRESGGLRRLWRRGYPNGLGLFYAAMTDRIGLKPNEEEYILMGMAALGAPRFAAEMRADLLGVEGENGALGSSRPPPLDPPRNLHRGARWWRPDIGPVHHADIAASVQAVAEEYILALAIWARARTRCENLVLGGGVALNCVAATRVARAAGFQRVAVAPNPGDAGNSLGAAAALAARPLAWDGPFLGSDAGSGDGALPDLGAMTALLARGEAVGLCWGRAEFGPRALGHRSLLADPRRADAKDRVNAIKGREPFRPFAPAVLLERAAEHFDMPVPESPLMQFVARVRHPDRLPGIAHVDGTARVQTVGPRDSPALRALLLRFEAETGSPVLLNTSMNVKGEPLANTRDDAERFAAATGVRVF